MDHPERLHGCEDPEALLRAHGITPTRQRLQIACVLRADCGHLSADQVLARVNEIDPGTSRATVYNTLNLFAEQGLVRQVIVDPQRVFFDANVSPHFHLYDVDTGELTDVDASGVHISGLPVLPEGTVTQGLEVVIRVRRAGRPGT